MNVESILERKGTEVATIAPEASIKRAADWLRAKNVGASCPCTSYVAISVLSPSVTLCARFLSTASQLCL